MQIPVELKAIQYMMVIEQEGSIQKAAEALFISQPALSQYIKRLEDSLSYPLYDRKNGRCILTKSGKILVEQGRTLMAEYQKMLKDMDAATFAAREVRFGWPTGYTVRYFQKISSGLSKNPLLNIHGMENMVERLILLLLQGNLDLIFVPAVYAHPNLDYTTIHREEFCLAVPKSIAADASFQMHIVDGAVDLQDLREMPFVTVNAASFTAFLDPLFGSGGTPPNKLFTCQDWDSAYQLVEQGAVLSVIPLWYAEKNSTEVQCYPIRSQHNTYRIFACVAKCNEPMTPERQAVIDFVMDSFGDCHAGQDVPPEFLTLPFRFSG